MACAQPNEVLGHGLPNTTPRLVFAVYESSDDRCDLRHRIVSLLPIIHSIVGEQIRRDQEKPWQRHVGNFHRRPFLCERIEEMPTRGTRTTDRKMTTPQPSRDDRLEEQTVVRVRSYRGLQRQLRLLFARPRTLALSHHAGSHSPGKQRARCSGRR